MLKKGDGISKSLFHAIETSLISVMTFSPNYASSSCYLDELVKIVELREKKCTYFIAYFLPKF